MHISQTCDSVREELVRSEDSKTSFLANENCLSYVLRYLLWRSGERKDRKRGAARTVLPELVPLKVELGRGKEQDEKEAILSLVLAIRSPSFLPRSFSFPLTPILAP